MTKTTLRNDPSDTMRVHSIMGLSTRPFRTDWRMEAQDCNGGDWIIEFTSGQSFDSASAFAESVRAVLSHKRQAEDFSGAAVTCYLSDTDTYKVSHAGYLIPLDALTFTAVPAPVESLLDR